MAHTDCLVCFISTVNGHCNKKRNPWKAGASSGHTTNLKQSILRLSISMVQIKKIPLSFEIYSHAQIVPTDRQKISLLRHLLNRLRGRGLTEPISRWLAPFVCTLTQARTATRSTREDMPRPSTLESWCRCHKNLFFFVRDAQGTIS
jgi:hypothetical protein